MTNFAQDERMVLTLDAGATHFRFSACRGGRRITDTITLPSNGDDLERSLANLVEGFTTAKKPCPHPPVAISFAFPGPADYPNGIITDPPNLPAFRGGVALGPMLEHRFGLPVFINNDGDLFAYGEALAGLLPWANGLLEREGNPKRFRNLLGVTIGTGFGGGIVSDGRLLAGDNSIAGEVWLLRNKLHPALCAEEGVSIRAIRRDYAESTGSEPATAPSSEEICEIGLGRKPGNQAAAVEAFRRLGETAGDAIAQALTLVDGLVVIGGGISGAWPLFLPALVAEINGNYTGPGGGKIPRIASVAFNLEDAGPRAQFLAGSIRELVVPGANRKVKHDSLRRVGVGISRLGTSEAIALGAYAFALSALDEKQAR